LNSELTRTNKAFFNVQMSPAYGEDKAMTREDWYQAADILAAETGYADQRRIIVLHTKKGRTHAHVIWERYNHESGKMIDNKQSRYKVDAARPKIEQALGHKATNRRNPHKNEIKETVTEIWNRTSTGKAFMAEVRKSGYMVAAGSGSRPFMIVDGNGRSFDLVRQIDGAKTKDVRERLRHEKLILDKQAIDLMRKETVESGGKRDKQKTEHKPAAAPTVAETNASEFAVNRTDTVQENKSAVDKRKQEQVFAAFKIEEENIAPAVKAEASTLNKDRQRKEAIAKQFADNDLSGKSQPSEHELEMQKIMAEQERIRQRNLTRKRHR
ncbi:relaxase/mobilization nuclease domain-containing protein, partial [Mucilaginibacter sp.]|uniref:relaxase/mobilization nuclease domain-containing protein n=1 Tax=Mucilaginibacter sp. TaxID=1882438 RepID=UPI0035BC488A